MYNIKEGTSKLDKPFTGYCNDDLGNMSNNVAESVDYTYLWFGRWVPSNTGRHDSRNSVGVHLIHSCIATEPVEDLQQQLQGALVGCRQLGNDQTGQGWLLTAVLDQLRKQPV